ncbi:MAG: hypothetical protein AAGA16_00310 [Cyanobacteria bacterium P01_E01_bin.35]
MSHIFESERIDRLFQKYAQVQYQQDLLFSSQVDLMSLVVCGIQCGSSRSKHTQKQKEIV